MSGVEGKAALVVGAGGMGGAAALALAAGGVRRIVLVDPAPVEARDLASHPLLAEADVGRRRDAAAAARLAARFGGMDAVASDGALDGGSAPGLLRSADVVVDASNTFATMFLVNDAAAAAGTPVVHGGVLQYSAQLLTTVFGTTACLRCLFEAPPPRPGAAPSDAEGLGPLAGFAGALLGSEALRLLEGAPGAYAGKLFMYEARSRRSRAVPVKPRPGCPACESAARIREAAGGATA